MKTIYYAITAALVLISSSRGEVLIYQGSARVHSDAASPVPAAARLYLVLEPSTQRYVTISYFRNGADKVMLAGDPAGIFSTRVILGGGRSGTAYSLGSTFE